MLLESLSFFTQFLYLFARNLSEPEIFYCEVCVNDGMQYKVVGTGFQYLNGTKCAGVRLEPPQNSSILFPVEKPPSCEVCHPEGYRFTSTSVGWLLENGTVCGNATFQKKEVIITNLRTGRDTMGQSPINIT